MIQGVKVLKDPNTANTEKMTRVMMKEGMVIQYFFLRSNKGPLTEHLVSAVLIREINIGRDLRGAMYAGSARVKCIDTLGCVLAKILIRAS
jgi:hypothetical protein